jgi:RnfABCDGE-type electron transport complex B subunit
MELTFLISIAAMGGLGLFFAVFLVIADKKLRVEEDPKVEKILDVLPMTNCGACGLGGCHVFAEQLADDKIPVNACVPGGQEVCDKLAELIGVDAVKAQKLVAVVLCRGGYAETQQSATYRGEKSCIAADLTGGGKSCVYGCLCYGDCVAACNFEAMAMNDNGLPVFFYDKCVACAACVKACPRDLIEMHPVEHKLFVYCKNRDKGAVAKNVCKVACIACKLCEKDCEVEGGITIEDNLAIVNYELCPQNEVTTLRCPTSCILFDEEWKITRESFYSTRLKKAV